MLKITEKYSDFSNLNKKVIKPSLDIINKCSDINVTYNPIRSGKFIKWIEFIITSKSTNTIKEDNTFKERIPTAFNEISTALNKYNIELTSEDAELLFNSAIEITQQKYKNKDAVSFILDKIKVLDNYILNKKVDNIIGFLNTAIQKDWKSVEANPVQKSNSFNNFEGRNYTEEDYDNMENGLLGWQ